MLQLQLGEELETAVTIPSDDQTDFIDGDLGFLMPRHDDAGTAVATHIESIPYAGRTFCRLPGRLGCHLLRGL